MFNVRDYGAVGDRQHNDTRAIQKAIETCSRAGGGTVYFPAGDYLSGMLRLPSYVTLHLDAGATLWASTDPRDYEKQYDYENSGGLLVGALILAEDAKHVALVGEGVIHGQGTADFGARWGVPQHPSFRTGLCLFKNSHHVTIQGLTMLYSDAWTVHFQRCETVFVDRVTILNNPRRLNSDGIDPNSCQNVHISNCHIVSGDDCIALKTTEPYPCENIVVTNCTLETTCTAVKLGTESFGDFRNIHFSNCTISNSPVGIGIYMKDGATVEQVTFSNLSIHASTRCQGQSVVPIFIDIEKRGPDSCISTIQDIIFRDIHINSNSGILIQGMPESPIEDLIMQNVTLRVDEAADYAERCKPKGSRRTMLNDSDTMYARSPSYLVLAHVRGLMLDNIRVLIAEDAFQKHPRSAIYGYNLEDGLLRTIVRQPDATEKRPAIIVLQDCRRMSVLDSQNVAERSAA